MAWVVALGLLLPVGLPAQEPETVPARLAAAKLAETRGDMTAAEQQLRAALAQATAGEREGVQAALRALLQRMGRPVEDGAPAAGSDPVHRLIAVLDTGGSKDETVKAACDSLGSLGGLAIPHLLAALPKLGPFGIGNVLQLLRSHADPRIVDAVAELVRKADPAVALVIADKIIDFRPEVATPLARRLFAAESGNPAAVRAKAWFCLCKRGVVGAADAAAVAALAQDGEADTQGNVVAGCALVEGEWVMPILRQLIERGASVYVRDRAILALARRAPDAEEGAIARQLEALPLDYRRHTAASIAKQRKAWTEVAAMALRAGQDATTALVLLQETEWWRTPEASADLLLHVPGVEAGSGGQFSATTNFAGTAYAVPRARVDALQRLVDRGWQLPPARDGELIRLIGEAQYSGGTFARFLPPDGEDRALATFTSVDESFGVGVAVSSVQLGRPWFRLTVRGLAVRGLALPGGTYERLLERSWDGAAADVIQDLVGVVGRTRQENNLNVVHIERVMRTCPSLPVALLFPFLDTAQGLAAFQLAEERDAEALLSWLRSNPKVADNDNLASQVVSLLLRHGGQLDVPLAVHLVRSGTSLGEVSLDEIVQFLGAHGRGHLDIVRFAERPIRLVPADRWVALATEAADTVGTVDFAKAAALWPSLEPGCSERLHARLLEIVRREHAARLIADLRAAPPIAFGGDPRVAAVLAGRIELLAKAGDPAAIPLLDQLLADPALHAAAPESAWGRVALLVARSRLDLSPAPRVDVVRSMLASERVAEVHAAILTPEAWQPEQAQLLVTAAVAAAKRGALQHPFASAPDAARLPFCRAVLAHQDLANCGAEFVADVVQVLGDARDPADIPLLARASTHGVAAVRKHVAEQLGRTLSPEAAGPLMRLLRDDDPSIRYAAEAGLTALANYIDSLDKWQKRFPDAKSK